MSSDACRVAKALTFDFIFAFVVNQTVICWLLSAESEVRSQGSLSDGGGEQSYSRTDSSPTTSVLPSQ